MDGAQQLTAVAQDGSTGTRSETGRMAIDLSHHLSELAKARRLSPLKTFSKYMGLPGIISLAGGLPDPSYFPLDSLTLNVLSTDTFATDEESRHQASTSAKSGWFSWFSKPSNKQVTVPKYAKQPTPASLQLATALQYGGADGLLFLKNFLHEWTTILSPPLYDDWAVLVDDGATDGWHKVIETLCEHNDRILVEAYSYPSAIESGWPMGIRPVPLPIDHEGLIPEEMDKILSEWDEAKHDGARKPRLLYTVPVGQNPTGGTAGKVRKQQIYEVCVKHDVILCEDDPYYILQFTDANAAVESKNGDSLRSANRDFINSLSPSYLTFDYEGRVIRLDTFSKTVAPGSRLGWITSNARFSERLLRASETSTQQPSGFAQVVVGKILETWGMEGWIRWLRGLRAQYHDRRDVAIHALEQGFKVELQSEKGAITSERGVKRYVGYAKYDSSKRTPLNTVDLNEKLASFGLSEGRQPLISFVPPDGGMFVWVTVYARHHKTFDAHAPAAKRREMTRDLMNNLWVALANHKLLIAPGWMFAGDGLRAGAPDEAMATLSVARQQEDEAMLASAGVIADQESGIGHFRLAFSYDSHDKLREGVSIFAKTVTEFFE